MISIIWGKFRKKINRLYHFCPKKAKKAKRNLLAFFFLVEVTGLEPATAWSQTRNATNCATPRFLLQISEVPGGFEPP